LAACQNPEHNQEPGQKSPQHQNKLLNVSAAKTSKNGCRTTKKPASQSAGNNPSMARPVLVPSGKLPGPADSRNTGRNLCPLSGGGLLPVLNNGDKKQLVTQIRRLSPEQSGAFTSVAAGDALNVCNRKTAGHL